MGVAFGAGLVFAALGPFAPADGLVSVTRPAEGRGCHIQVAAIIEAPIEDVHAVVAELGRYNEWFPSVRSSARRTDSEYELWFRLPWPLRNVRERVVVADEANAEAAVVRWRHLDGDFARNEGSWRLRSLGANRTAVRYDNVVQFRRWVPAWLLARAERRVAPQMIRAIEDRANQRARGRATNARASR